MPSDIRHAARLVTGATGFVGRHLVLRLLERGDPVVAVVRGDDGAARLRVALREAARSLALPPDRVPDAGLHVVPGDITRPELGLDAAGRATVTALGCRELWHLASGLRFDDRQRGEAHRENVVGVRHALALARRLSLPRFVHLSTAHTAGRRRGIVHELLHSRAGPFNNCYEESKCLAEWEVREFCGAHGIDAQVLRPSVVVGPRSTRRSGGASSGLYGFVRLLVAARGARGLRGDDEPMALPFDPATPVHLVPVDHVVDDCVHLIDHGFLGGGVHHLTTERSLHAQEAIAVVCEEVGLRPLAPTSATGALHALGPFLACLREPKVFARTLPPRPGLTAEELRGYVRCHLESMATPVAARVPS